MSVEDPTVGNPTGSGRTRHRIRTEAYRLFRERGYGDTTVEQIAEAAGVSPSEFLRHFPTKDQVVLTARLEPLMKTALAREPRDLPPLTAFRNAVTTVFVNLTAENLAFEQEREALLYHIPDLRAAVTTQFERDIDAISGLLAERLGRDEMDFEIRVAAGAIAGCGLAIAKMVPVNADNISRALTLLEAGLPLRAE
ncbi:TetR/AcrR family transcriptional regulator [Nocardia takedensis]|uniref:TetR/AcrR family transcriptional regulator n=1 Tax=Nocardia takedensis TaxID=259390 RepID=UPI000593880C|nr:TetR family transcriptional regulator [Nocardia takedensis]